jgi:hypothetical protein
MKSDEPDDRLLDNTNPRQRCESRFKRERKQENQTVSAVSMGRARVDF